MTTTPTSPPRLRVGPVSALLFGIGLLVLGNGLQGTLLGVRAGLEGFRQETIGLMMSAYFAGYVAGSIWSSRLIDQAGHIRAFAALASIASAAALVHALTVEPVSWTLLRALNGACYAGLGIVTESWLNGHAAPARRGQLLAIYGMVTMGAWAASQLLLNLADPAGFVLFCLVSVLLSLALVPIALTRATVPITPNQTRVSLKKLYAISPLGFAGCLLAGLAMSAFWGMGPTFAQQIGLNNARLSLFMAAPIVGAVVSQWPLGWLSDRIDRRGVIAAASLLNGLVCLALAGWSGPLAGLLGLASLFGGLGIPLYSLCVAHTNDHIKPEELVSVAGGLLLLYGLGAALGPFAAGVLMGQMGPPSLFFYTGLLQLVLFAFALYRISYWPAVPKTKQDAFVAMPGPAHLSSQAVFEFDPRGRQKTPAVTSTSKGDN